MKTKNRMNIKFALLDIDSIVSGLLDLIRMPQARQIQLQSLKQLKALFVKDEYKEMCKLYLLKDLEKVIL